MNHLVNELAPVNDAAWTQITDEAQRTLAHFLAARKLVDFVGPLGWDASTVPGGRLQAPTSSPAVDVSLRVRRVHPVTELRRAFTLDRHELDAAERGARTIDLGPLVEAARWAAFAEDWSVFHPSAVSGLEGIVPASPHATLPIGPGAGPDTYPQTVAQAVEVLREAGVGGPYGLALGPAAYQVVVGSTEVGGYPLLEHLRTILAGPVVWAPAVEGAVVVSLRGGDFELSVGQDFSVGYAHHDADTVALYLESSFAFRVHTPEAAVSISTTNA